MSAFALGTTILGRLRAGLELVKTFEPLIHELPGGAVVEKVIAIATATTEVVQNTVTRIDEGHIVATASDTQEIKNILEELQAVNDRLAQAIAAS